MPGDGEPPPADPPDDDGSIPGGVDPGDDEVVAAAVEAAEGVIFSRYSRSDIRDLDVAVRYESGRLDVDVYLNVPDARDDERVAEDAVLAARRAVDELLEG